MKLKKGFTLIELMIVVAVILIIAAIAIPGYLNSKMAANEASAINSIRAINVAQVSYQTTYPQKGYASSLTALGGPDSCNPTAESACLLDPDLTSGIKAGYMFNALGGNPVNQANLTYVAGAAPQAFKHTGIRRFCSTERGLIRRDANSAGSEDLPTAEDCAGFTRLQ